jgi:hypothetical protein
MTIFCGNTNNFFVQQSKFFNIQWNSLKKTDASETNSELHLGDFHEIVSNQSAVSHTDLRTRKKALGLTLSLRIGQPSKSFKYQKEYKRSDRPIQENIFITLLKELCKYLAPLDNISSSSKLGLPLYRIISPRL